MSTCSELMHLKFFYGGGGEHGTKVWGVGG